MLLVCNLARPSDIQTVHLVGLKELSGCSASNSMAPPLYEGPVAVFVR